jgi:hypothetical protein
LAKIDAYAEKTGLTRHAAVLAILDRGVATATQRAATVGELIAAHSTTYPQADGGRITVIGRRPKVPYGSLLKKK